MKVVISTVTDSCNSWFFESFVKFHSQYADKILVALDNFNKEFDLTPEQYEIAKQHNVEVYPLGFKWYESKVWKQCITKALQYSPKWIGVMGSDEIFEQKFLEKANEMFDNVQHYWYSFGVFHMWEDFDHYRVDGVWGISSGMQVKRFFRNCLPSYNLGDREWHSECIPQEIQDKSGLHTGLKLKHCGYVKKDAWLQRCEARGIGYGNANENFGSAILKKWEG